MKTKKIIIPAAVVLFLLCAFAWLYFSYAAVGSGLSRVLCRTDAAELDLTDSSITSLGGIGRVRGLRHLDVRGLDLSAEDIDAAKDALPECEILWSVPFSSGAADCGKLELTLPDADASDLALVRYMTGLEKLDIGECELYEEIFALRDELECEIVWQVKIGGESYPCDTAELTLGDVSAQEVSKLRWLPELKNVDARGCGEYAALLEASELLPECEIVWECELLGRTALSTDTVFDLSGVKIEDLGAFRSELEKVITYLPKLEKIDMCGCGISNEEMAALNEDYPDIKFVWLVTFGANNKYTVRTDITCFSTLLGNSKKGCGNEKDYENLFLYCTDLVALDMGHNELADISLMSNLTKLQMLILTDNKIVDLSPLAACEDLFFLEVNKNRVNDVSPIAQMKSIKYVTLHYNKAEDITPLYTADNLRILVLSENFGIPKTQRGELVDKLPDCNIYFELPYGTGTGKEWDSLPERIAVKNAFTNWEDIEEFRSWDDIIWK